MQDEGMESAPRTQPAPEPPLPPEAAPGHRLPCIWTMRDLGQITFGIWWNEYQQIHTTPNHYIISAKVGLSIKNTQEDHSLRVAQHVRHLRSAVAHLVCVMAREKRDIIGGKVVADLLDLPIAFPFPPLGSPVLEPNLSNTKKYCIKRRLQVLFRPLTLFCLQL